MLLTGDFVQRTSAPDAGSALESECAAGALPLPEEVRPAFGAVAEDTRPRDGEAGGEHWPSPQPGRQQGNKESVRRGDIQGTALLLVFFDSFTSMLEENFSLRSSITEKHCTSILIDMYTIKYQCDHKNYECHVSVNFHLIPFHLCVRHSAVGVYVRQVNYGKIWRKCTILTP